MPKDFFNSGCASSKIMWRKESRTCTLKCLEQHYSPPPGTRSHSRALYSTKVRMGRIKVSRAEFPYSTMKILGENLNIQPNFHRLLGIKYKS